jgi:DNA-binding XRE family transcriptional regulator
MTVSILIIEAVELFYDARPPRLGTLAVTTMTGLQARLARTALNRSVRELAKLCDVSTKTLQRIELDDPLVKIVTVRKVQRAYEQEGVVFSAEGRGIKLRAK